MTSAQARLRTDCAAAENEKRCVSGSGKGVTQALSGEKWELPNMYVILHVYIRFAIKQDFISLWGGSSAGGMMSHPPIQTLLLQLEASYEKLFLSGAA